MGYLVVVMSKWVIFSLISMFFVYMAFFLSILFTSLSIKYWLDVSSLDSSDMTNINNIIDIQFFIPISAFSLHVFVMAFIYYKVRKTIQKKV